MKRFTYAILLLVFLIGLASCSEVDGPAANADEWLVPSSEVYDGGPGKDGIPALIDPEFISASEINYLADDDLVLGVSYGDELRAYPHPILDWHEIINDKVGDISFAVTYCPLTGSGISWNRVVDGSETSFGVSGLLFDSNLIPYDRASDSYWSQMGLTSIHGEHIGMTPETYNIIELPWSVWRSIYPESMVVSSSTGFNRNYGAYPYGSYRSNDDYFLFPVSYNDSRLPAKERVIGVIVDRELKVYPFSEFGTEITLIEDEFKGQSIIVVGSSELNIAVLYGSTTLSGVDHTFSALNNELPAIMVDEDGSRWDIFGRAFDGPNEGEELEHKSSYIAYWFAWGTFYPFGEIHGQE